MFGLKLPAIRECDRNLFGMLNEVIVCDNDTLVRVDDDADPAAFTSCSARVSAMSKNFWKKGSLRSGFRSWAIFPLTAMLTTLGVTFFTRGARVGIAVAGLAATRPV